MRKFLTQIIFGFYIKKVFILKKYLIFLNFKENKDSPKRSKEVILKKNNKLWLSRGNNTPLEEWIQT